MNCIEKSNEESIKDCENATVGEVFSTLTFKQKGRFYGIAGLVINEKCTYETVVLKLADLDLSGPQTMVCSFLLKKAYYEKLESDQGDDNDTI